MIGIRYLKGENWKWTKWTVFLFHLELHGRSQLWLEVGGRQRSNKFGHFLKRVQTAKNVNLLEKIAQIAGVF